MSIETHKGTLNDLEKGNTDVVVLLDNDKKYIASFFSYANIYELAEQHRKDGSYLNGDYFWDKNIVLIRSLNRKMVTATVKHLIEEGEFKEVFKQIT